MPKSDAIRFYLGAIASQLKAGTSTEHTYRPALKQLLESLFPEVTATNEPKHIECGAPDFVVSTRHFPLGYIECKDVGRSLDEAEKSTQLKRYLKSLPNLILTDYLEFRWFVDGEKRTSVRIADPSSQGLNQRPDNISPFTEMLQGFIDYDIPELARPEDLARRLARTTHMLRDVIVGAFAPASRPHNCCGTGVRLLHRF